MPFRPCVRMIRPKGIASIKLPKTEGHHTWRRWGIVRYHAHWPLGTQPRPVMEFAFGHSFTKDDEQVVGAFLKHLVDISTSTSNKF